MVFLRLVTLTLTLSTLAVQAQDLPLPGLEPRLESGRDVSGAAGGTFLKPTVSIKPPNVAADTASTHARSVEQILGEEQKVLMEKAALFEAQRGKDARVTAALKRIVLMEGPVSKKLPGCEFLPQGVEGKPVTLVGVHAPQEVVRGLESFFGAQLTPDNEKKLLDTVRKGMAHSSKRERKVEVLGWWPKEGVMAVGVYPES